MKIGVFAVLFGDKPFEDTLDYLVDLGVEAVEIGTGAYPGNAHCDPKALLASDKKLNAFRDAVKSRNLVISALSCPALTACTAADQQDNVLYYAPPPSG